MHVRFVTCFFTAVQCPSLPSITNGVVLTTDTTFHFGDDVGFLCNLGFQMNGPRVVTCLANGTWSVDVTALMCSRAICQLPDFSGLQFPPTILPAVTQLEYRGVVLVTCDHLRAEPLRELRRCNFYSDVGEYAVFHPVSFHFKTLVYRSK